jgi:hypothetical protein
MTLNKVDTYDSSVMISANDASTITGMDVAEVRKAIKMANLEPTAEVKTGKRGRPPKLFGREELLSAIAAARAAASAAPTPKVASEVAGEIASESSVASDEFDTAVA